MTRVYEDVRGMLDINSSDLLNSHLIMLDFLTAVCVNKKHSAASLNTPQNGGTFKLPGKTQQWHHASTRGSDQWHHSSDLIPRQFTLNDTFIRSPTALRLCWLFNFSQRKKKKSELLFRNQSAKKLCLLYSFLARLPATFLLRNTLKWSVYQLRLL